MMNKKRRINLSKKDFDKKLKFVKEFCEIKYNEEPKVGITLLKVTPSIISTLFDKELRDKILSVSKEEK